MASLLFNGLGAHKKIIKRPEDLHSWKEPSSGKLAENALSVRHDNRTCLLFKHTGVGGLESSPSPSGRREERNGQQAHPVSSTTACSASFRTLHVACCIKARPSFVTGPTAEEPDMVIRLGKGILARVLSATLSR